MGRPIRLRLAIAVFVAVVLMGIVGGLRGTPEHDNAKAQGVAHSSAPSPSKHGAVVAAIRFLSGLTLDVLLDDARRRRVVEQAASPESREQLLRLYDEERDRVAESYRRPPRLARAALLGYRIDQFTPRAATVSIWAASIGGSRQYAPATGWSTTTVSVAWSGKRWLVTRVEDNPGPSADWPIEALASEAHTFREFRHAP